MNSNDAAILIIGMFWLFFFVNVWFLGRMLFSGQPEMVALRSDGWPIILNFLACLLVITGAIIGVWYIVAGPTRARSARRIEHALNSIDAKWLADFINRQIDQDRLWDSEWVKKNWIDLSPSDRVRALESCGSSQLKGGVRNHLKAYSHRTGMVSMDSIAVLRETLQSRESS